MTLGSTGRFSIADAVSGEVLTDSNSAATVTLASTGDTPRYRISHSGGTREVTGPVRVSSASGFVTINGQRYRGRGEARVNSAGRLAGVNELPLELYLYGVVPRELGPVAFPEVEAQKVQAIAARTYALSYLGRRAADGYDLRATVDDQVYGGFAAEHPVSTAAVDSTRGVVLTLGGSLILARYSSTSGGHTADNEESFAEGPVPYLRGVPDMPASPAAEYVPTLEAFKSHPTVWDLRTPPTPLDLDRPRYHRWTFEWTAAELSSTISNFVRRPVGAVKAMNVVQRGPSGRIITLEFITDSGTFSASRGAIRAALRYINASGASVNLPSALFFIEPMGGDEGTAPMGFRVYGGGFGHGTGMAQVGAVIMARQGIRYPEILRHYYRGVELTKLY